MPVYSLIPDFSPFWAYCPISKRGWGYKTSVCRNQRSFMIHDTMSLWTTNKSADTTLVLSEKYEVKQRSQVYVHLDVHQNSYLEDRHASIDWS